MCLDGLREEAMSIKSQSDSSLYGLVAQNCMSHCIAKLFTVKTFGPFHKCLFCNQLSCTVTCALCNPMSVQNEILVTIVQWCSFEIRRV